MKNVTPKTPFNTSEMAAIGELAALHDTLRESTKPEIRALATVIAMRVGEICMGAKPHALSPEEILAFAKRVEETRANPA
jgi:hypothetical protein